MTSNGERYISTKRQLIKFQGQIANLIEGFKPIKEKSKEKFRIRKNIAFVCIIIGVVGYLSSGDEKFTSICGITSIVFILSGAIFLFITYENAKDLAFKVKSLVKSFQNELFAIEPVVKHVEKILENELDEVPSMISARERIKLCSNDMLVTMKEQLDSTRATEKLENIVSTMTNLGIENFPSDVKNFIKVIIDLLKICILMRKLFGNEVTPLLVDLIIEKLELIQKDFSSIIEQLYRVHPR